MAGKLRPVVWSRPVDIVHHRLRGVVIAYGAFNT
jgi:hypothetical protein